MTKSERIRELGREGVPVAQIATQLGIRYQHAYNVMQNSGFAITKRARIQSHAGAKRTDVVLKPVLTIAALGAGFILVGTWRLSDDNLFCDEALPKPAGVYAFVREAEVLYVGFATTSIAKRLYFYGKPGPRQLTNLRLNKLIKAELSHGRQISIYAATPPDLEWNGLPIHGAAGLELGLIKRYSLPCNVRSNG